jgi:putative tryptophan/tyrosine transport system substrate-binding protein
MKRREFIAGIGSAAAWPLAVRAQQPVMPVIGFLSSSTSEALGGEVAAFHCGLADSGYVEGRNVAIEYRWAENHFDRLPALAVELVRRQVSVIVTTGGLSPALAAKAATTTIPIVFDVGVDPVETGLVMSLNRPGGNLTGITGLNSDIVAKRLEMLHQLTPTATLIAVLVNPTNAGNEPQTKLLQVAASVLGVRLLILGASSQSDFAGAFATLAQQRAGALVVMGDPFFNVQRDQLIALATRHGVPAIYQFREDVSAGGLVSYGADLQDMYRQCGVYAGRILKGEKPADLPVQQATKIELVINLKTAKVLGLTVPTSILLRADEVIE